MTTRNTGRASGGIAEGRQPSFPLGLNMKPLGLNVELITHLSHSWAIPIAHIFSHMPNHIRGHVHASSPADMMEKRRHKSASGRTHFRLMLAEPKNSFHSTIHREMVKLRTAT
jgi:hypothetical protein